MSHEPLDPLPSHVLALFELEKDAYPVEPRMQEAVFAHVERAVLLAAPLTAGPASTAAAKVQAASSVAGAAKATMTGKLVAVGLAAFTAGGVVGGTAVAVRDASRPPMTVASSASIAAVPRVPAVIPSTPWSSVEAAEVPTAAPSPGVPATRPGKPASSPEAAGDLLRERELLDAARAALGHGAPEDAIVAAKKHAERWPKGALAEEREVVLIQALVAAGRRADAVERAREFRRAFPRSMFGATVDVALAPAASAP